MTKSTGRQKERERLAREAIDRCFDEIIRLVGDGIPMVRAITMVPQRPTINAVRQYMRNFPEQWDRFQKVRTKAFGSLRSRTSFSEEAWSDTLAAISNWDGILKDLRRQGQPTYDQCWQRAGRDPVFKVRLRAAIKARNERPDKKPIRFEKSHFDAAIDYIRGNRGKKLADIDLELKARRLPSMVAIYSARLRSGNNELREEYAGISMDRGVRRYSDEQHAQALEVLKSDPVNARKILRQNAGKLPSMKAIYGRGKTYAITAEIFEEARLVRREAYREIWAAARLARKANRKSRAQPYLTNVLRSGLLLDDLYSEARKLFHPAIPAHERDDMISEVVLAVWEKRITREEIATRGKAIGWKFANSQNNRRFDSLDAPVFEDSHLAYVDTLSSDQWSFEGAI
ncbi:MAG: hypothetical protein EKK35_08205 [Bradyrhizobiaceae bacterium]|nr:MAG: hypothetical protein EKK35_08205 [Bradyrhizobiaceae bacterium]